MKVARLTALALLAAALPPPAAAQSEAKALVSWKGQRHALEALPAEVPEAARAAVAAWAAWAGEARYSMDLGKDGRVMLVTPAGASASRQRTLAERTLQLFDKLLPAAGPKAPQEPVQPPPPEDPEGPLPEDPGGATGPKARPPQVGEPRWSYAWGAGSRPLDTETAVLVVLRNPADYANLLAFLAKGWPYLAEWTAQAKGASGFVLEEPLAGAYLLSAPGMEEWDPDAELVHRTAELNLLRRFGRQPYWVQQGLAWQVEQSIKGGIYCFPYRTGFVGVGEHGGWDKDLKRAYAELPGDEVTLSDVTGLRRGIWDEPRAKAAWGAVGFLLRAHAEGFRDALAELYADWDANSRVERGGGHWVRDLDYEVPPATQRAILERTIGPEVLAELALSFQKGKDYRPR
jgi:hypothetical protein